jgi:transcriptional antiterminator RfaH
VEKEPERLNSDAFRNLNALGSNSHSQHTRVALTRKPMGASMYWAVARAQPNRESIAQHFLQAAGYTVYLPRLREYRVSHGRKIETRKPLFPAYLFVEIITGWWQARYCPGTLGLVMNCDQPARVPAVVVDDIRQREINGAIELPRPPRFKRGDSVRIVGGAFAGQLAVFEGMKPRERVEVLLGFLGGSQRVTMAQCDVEPTS